MDRKIIKRFMDKVSVSDGCWQWKACIDLGYGAFSVNGKSCWAHRVSYELFVGPIPKGMQVDHLCRNRACVNPLHLEAVTQKVNILRGEGFSAKNARKTHCIHGHLLEGDNLSIKKRSDGQRDRVCRTCHRRHNTFTDQSFHDLPHFELRK
jgi:hypothetical protein